MEDYCVITEVLVLWERGNRIRSWIPRSLALRSDPDSRTDRIYISNTMNQSLLHNIGEEWDFSLRMISLIDTTGSLSAKPASAVALKTKST